MTKIFILKSGKYSRLSLFIILSIGILAPWGVVFLELLKLEVSEQYHHIADAVAISAALVGLYLALQHKSDTAGLRENANKLEDLIHNLDTKYSKIAEATSTRFIEVFPKNIDEICHLIESTKENLFILSDVAGYAHYSDPKAFFKYRQLLEKVVLEKAITVKMIVYDNEQADLALKSQLGAMNNDNWSTFVIEHKAKAYAEMYPDKMDKALKSPDDFAEMIKQNEIETRNRFRENRIKVGRTKNKIPFYVWISDEDAAIISYIARSNPNALEYSFLTYDHKLIEALKEVVKSFEQGEDIEWEN